MYWFLVMRSDLGVKRGDIGAVKGRSIGAAPWVEMGLRRLLIEAGIDLDRDGVKIAPVPGALAAAVRTGEQPRLAAEGDAARAKAQFDAGGNMTDVLAALAALCGIDCPERAQALTAFHAAWRDDPLVLDKWFSLQAISPLPGTMATVHALAEHPDFDLRNPNRVRSLVGSFAFNQVRFHAADGSGYRFLADMIGRLDPANPQIAARMVSPLGQWRRFDAGRQERMKAELRRIVAVAGLSKNTFEMASKSLAE
jgi:aminopeptidase N